MNRVTKQKFAEIVKSHRLRKGWTQLELSAALGFEHAQFVHLMESGKSKIPLDVMGKLIVILGLPEKQIINEIFLEHEKTLRTEIDLGKELAQQWLAE